MFYRCVSVTQRSYCILSVGMWASSSSAFYFYLFIFCISRFHFVSRWVKGVKWFFNQWYLNSDRRNVTSCCCCNDVCIFKNIFFIAFNVISTLLLLVLSLSPSSSAFHYYHRWGYTDQCECIIISELIFIYICNGAEWSKDRTQAVESIKWRPQQAYGSNQVLLAQPQTIFSTPKILTLTHR